MLSLSLLRGDVLTLSSFVAGPYAQSATLETGSQPYFTSTAKDDTLGIVDLARHVLMLLAQPHRSA